MLAVAAEKPFDSGDWSFEIKWDGFRAICRRDADGYKLLGRHETDFTPRFPLLNKTLNKLPAGTILDGEVVAFRNGKPDFPSLLKCTERRCPSGVILAYVAFDLLYENGRSLIDLPLRTRRERLKEAVGFVADPRLLFSQSVDGKDGVAYYERVVGEGLEGVVAKKLDSGYRPGIRSDCWLKIKARHEAVCVIVGFERSDKQELRSIIVAGDVDGELKYLGRVGSGLNPQLIRKLLPALEASQRKTPAVPCPGEKGPWVEPKLFCRVSYAELTETGKMRFPVLEKMIDAVKA